MGLDTPKQFVVVEGAPVIIHTMLAFQRHPDIDGIAVVCLEGWETILRSYADQFGVSKYRWTFRGGATGMESIRSGIYGLQGEGVADDDVVLIHDAVRPLVSQDIISNNIATCRKFGNAVTGITCREAVLESPDGLCATNSIPRDSLVRTQTPQTFRLGYIVDVHEEARAKGVRDSVASCTLIAELGSGRVMHIVQGEERNIKITTAEDLDIMRSLLNVSKAPWAK